MRFETSDELLNFVENWVGFGGQVMTTTLEVYYSY
jgi:hypothetical protein